MIFGEPCCIYCVHCTQQNSKVVTTCILQTRIQVHPSPGQGAPSLPWQQCPAHSKCSNDMCWAKKWVNGRPECSPRYDSVTDFQYWVQTLDLYKFKFCSLKASMKKCRHHASFTEAYEKAAAAWKTLQSPPVLVQAQCLLKLTRRSRTACGSSSEPVSWPLMPHKCWATVL